MSGSVHVAISSFRSDAAVIGLLNAIFTNPHSEVISVVVVESLGSGEIKATADARGWSIIYENVEYNLGSAGNLARRIELATQHGAQWVLCLNHDANWDATRLSSMLATARSRPRVGAVYPILDHTPRQPRFEIGRLRFVPSAGIRFHEVPNDGTAREVLWSSSNGALYSTAPFSEGIEVMDELWMGYEDLALGIALHKGNWLQLICYSAILSDIFDYEERSVLAQSIHIPSKPIWYSYYNIRNLILIRFKYKSGSIKPTVILWKLMQSSIKIVLLEKQKFARLQLLFRGAIDGIIGKIGKGTLP